MKRAALYLRVSTIDQNPETQGIELRQFAKQHGLSGEIQARKLLFVVAKKLGRRAAFRRHVSVIADLTFDRLTFLVGRGI